MNMIDILISFLIGVLVGNFFGMLLTGLCVAAGENKNYESEIYEQERFLKKENNINSKEGI